MATSKEILAMARRNQGRLIDSGMVGDPWLTHAEMTETVLRLSERLDQLEELIIDVARHEGALADMRRRIEAVAAEAGGRA